jgi:hypothetical protein
MLFFRHDEMVAIALVSVKLGKGWLNVTKRQRCSCCSMSFWNMNKCGRFRRIRAWCAVGVNARSSAGLLGNCVFFFIVNEAISLLLGAAPKICELLCGVAECGTQG